MTDQEYDTTEKVERTDKGYRLTVESTRGTGTRDQDKVKAELRTEHPPRPSERAELLEHVSTAIEQRRNHNPDAESE
jgi:hypothetical protein